jgi:hypothetical protein
MVDLAQAYRNLPPNTRRLVLAGGAGLAALVVLRGRSGAGDTSDAATDSAGAVDGLAYGGIPTTFDMGAIGVDQLMDFEADWATDLADAFDRIRELEERPQNTSYPRPPANTVQQTFVMTVNGKGETPNAIAVRLRKAGQRTADGRDLTASYLIRFNQWKTAATAPRWPGEIVNY